MPRSIRFTERFRYEIADGGNPPPLVRAEISIDGSHQIAVPLIVDSGAAGLLLPSEIAPYLGIDLSSAEEVPVGGVAGAGTGRKSPVRLHVRVGRLACRCNAVFITSAMLPDCGLLGREDWFHNFEVAFRHKLREILMVSAS